MFILRCVKQSYTERWVIGLCFFYGGTLACTFYYLKKGRCEQLFFLNLLIDPISLKYLASLFQVKPIKYSQKFQTKESSRNAGRNTFSVGQTLYIAFAELLILNFGLDLWLLTFLNLKTQNQSLKVVLVKTKKKLWNL